VPRQSARNLGVRPTREDVAKRANISGTTVSRVLSGRLDFQISPEVRERVLQAAQELGYTPNAAAKTLRSGRADLIGFWMCLQYSRYRSQVVDEMQRILFDEGLSMAVSDADQEYLFHHTLDRALRLQVDGIIAFDGFAAAAAFAQRHKHSKVHVPFVSMGAYWTEAYSYVAVDLKAGAIEATEHLLNTGRRRISYLAPGTSGLLTDGDRYEGFRDVMVREGLEAETIDISASTIDAIEDALKERKGRLPDAILCVNDDLAMDAVLALERLGLQAGKDVALVGFNGTEGTERGACPITTVRQPIEEMCATAYRFLKAQIDQPGSPPQQRTLKPTLIVRQSSLP